MFDGLKKKLKESVEKLSRKSEGRSSQEKASGDAFKQEPKTEGSEVAARPEPIGSEFSREIPRHEEEPHTHVVEDRHPEHEREIQKPRKEIPDLEGQKSGKIGIFGKVKERVTTRAISEEDIEQFFSENEGGMLESNVAMEVMDYLKKSLKEKLSERQARRFGAKDFVKEAFEESLYEVVNQGGVDLEDTIRKARSEGRPACLIFLGFNGSGKTTSIAKLAHYLKGKGHTPVLAAADTFRAASIEQLEVHGEKLGVKVIKHQYGADSAAVIFDAVKFAKTKGYDIVLADTAGRSHADKNLMDELTKVMRVNKPDLRILVVDSLTGNDAVEQAKMFEKAAGVDAIVLTKLDVNKKGGAILSVCYAIKKPILFLGTGQEYERMEMFEPRKFVHELLE